MSLKAMKLSLMPCRISWISHMSLLFNLGVVMHVITTIQQWSNVDTPKNVIICGIWYVLFKEALLRFSLGEGYVRDKR